MGLLTLSSSHELLASVVGRRVFLGFGVFWFVRLLCQLFVYSSELWRGKIFETVIHLLFTALWFYLTSVYLAGYWIGG